MNGTHQCDFLNFCGALGSNWDNACWWGGLHISWMWQVSCSSESWHKLSTFWRCKVQVSYEIIHAWGVILAEGAIALSVTLSGGALFASWKLLQFLSSLIVKVILAIFSWASAQLFFRWSQAESRTRRRAKWEGESNEKHEATLRTQGVCALVDWPCLFVGPF